MHEQLYNFASQKKSQQYIFSGPMADNNVSSKSNSHRPEGEHQKSFDKHTLPVRLMSALSFLAHNTSQPSDFHSTILPFRISDSPKSPTNFHDDNNYGKVPADTHGLPKEVREPSAALRPSTRTVTNHTVVNHLDMPGWSTTKIEYRRHETLVHAVLTTELTHCLNESCQSTNIKANGLTRQQYVAHTPLDGRPRRIAYRRQCYYCKDCKTTSLQPLRGLYKGTNMTRRLRRYIARQALLPSVSFNNLAWEIGRSARNIRDVFEKHRAHLESIREIETPEVMGMDGVYVKRQESLIVTDLERRRVVLMRPSIKERAMADALREMPNLDKVKEAVSDFAGSLDRVQKEVLPQAIRTKDRYHVQRMANAAVDEVRRALTPGRRERKKGQMGMCRSHILRRRKYQLKDHERADLEWCLGLYPELRHTYELKETYCDTWDSTDGTVARLKYAAWLELHKAWKKEMPKDLRDAFTPLIKLMKNWEEGIFNYFQDRHTNAYTESANAQIKGLTRKAPRAKFTTIDTKMVHGPRLEQQRKAIREKAKPRSQVQSTQIPRPSASLARDTAVGESPGSNERQTSIAAFGVIVDVTKKKEPHLDVDRLRALERKLEDMDDTAAPSSRQMLLFE
jgi:transposase